MSRLFLVLGSVSGALAVAAGAFGAHALRGRLDPRALEIYEVAARYQIYHALALLVVAIAAARWPGGEPLAAGWLFVAGTVVFSGSLYALSLGAPRWLGAVTPVGGLALIAGWLVLAVAAWRTPEL
jgi:uncharacterized membrane protein YgdD (TMEM256/DUF423 family)